MKHAVRPLALVLALAVLLGACTPYHQSGHSSSAGKTGYGHSGH